MKKKIKVLHVIADLGNGGAERQLIELLKTNKSHGVVVFKGSGVYKNTLDTLNIKYWELGINNKFNIFLKIRKISKIIRELNPHIVQSWMYNACFFSLICRMLGLYKAPLIWSIRCSDMTTKYYSLTLKLLIFACRLLSKKVDKIVYNSYSGMEYHTNRGFSSKNKTVILNGTDVKKFKRSLTLRKSLREKFKYKKDDIVIIFVARVDPMKNHQSFLNAFRQAKDKGLHNLKLILAGKNTEKLKLPYESIALGMKVDIEKYYNLADVIILPSSFGEGFSNVLVEGMLTSLFPVASNVGDSKKIIGDTGFIVENINDSGFLDILDKISKSRKATINQQGKKARLRVSKNFTSKIMVKAYHNLYSKML